MAHQFMRRVKERLENWSEEVVNLWQLDRMTSRGPHRQSVVIDAAALFGLSKTCHDNSDVVHLLDGPGPSIDHLEHIL